MDEEDEPEQGTAGARKGTAPPLALLQMKGRPPAQWTFPDRAATRLTTTTSSSRPGEDDEKTRFKRGGHDSLVGAPVGEGVQRQNKRKKSQRDALPKEEEEASTTSHLTASEDLLFSFAASKRFRHDDLDPLLSSTTPLLEEDLARVGGTAAGPPSILSVLSLPRDTARTVQWHPSGQVQVVTGNHHVYIFHSAGSYVEQLSKIAVTPGASGGGGAASRANREAMRVRAQMEKAIAAATLRSGKNPRASASRGGRAGGEHSFHGSVAGTTSTYASRMTSIQSSTLTASGEDVILVGKECYSPVQLHLATEQLTPLRFLDTRDVAVHRMSRAEIPKEERYITKIVSAYNSSSPRSSAGMAGGGGSEDSIGSLLAVASGCSVRLGSVSSGSVVGMITTNELVTDLQFLTNASLLYVASGKRVLVYDIRQMGQRFLYEHVDEGALSISSLSVSNSYLTLGSSTGVVSLYTRPTGSTTTSSFASGAGATWAGIHSGTGSSRNSSGYITNWTALKTFSQLTTSVAGVILGNRNSAGRTSRMQGGSGTSAGDTALCYFTGGQKAGFRLAHLSRESPYGVVVPSFPAVSLRHDFIHTVSFAPTLPILSVGERQRVVNYSI